MTACANSNRDVVCPRHATPGHIFCKPCRLQHAGYDRKPATKKPEEKKA